MGTDRRLCRRLGPAHNSILGHITPTQQPILRREGEACPECTQLRVRISLGWPYVRAPCQLRSRPDQAAGRRDDRPEEASICRGRSARRPWARNWRLQGRQRTGRGDARGTSLLFRRVLARPDARADHRRYYAGGSFVPRKGHRVASRGRRQALRDRQLPGRLGGDDGRRDPPGIVRADHRSGLAAVLLGRCPRPQRHALLRRRAWRQLAHRARRRLGQWQV